MTALLSVLAVLLWTLAIICCTNLVWEVPGLRRFVTMVAVAQMEIMEEVKRVHVL